MVPAGDDVAYQRRAIHDGDVIDAGPIQLRAVHTPGHTHHHISYVLHDEHGAAVGVFTGGSMLHGTTGRTDLLGDEHTHELTHAQFHSVRRLADELPDDAEVYPTHGFGSFCSATPGSGDTSTIAEQRTNNPALTQDEQTYVDELIAGLSAYPAYYAHMGVINSHGPAPVNLSPPAPVYPDELRRRIDAGEWVVDLRNRTAFAAGHLDGTLAFELSTSFVTYLGWLYTWGAPLTLIGDDHDQIAAAQRELVRIGVDNVTGSAVGDVVPLRQRNSAAVLPRRRLRRPGRRSGGETTSPCSTSANRASTTTATSPERSTSRCTNSPDRLDEVPAGEVWVHCGSGYRASIAASMLDRDDRTVVLVDDMFGQAAKLGLAA